MKDKEKQKPKDKEQATTKTGNPDGDRPQKPKDRR